MKFQKTDLIARIDAILKVQEAEAEARRRDVETKEAEARDAWITEHRDDFLYFAKNIQYLSKKGEPITIEAAPKEIRDKWGGQIKFFNTSSRWSADDTQNKSLQKLRNALLASQEDTVSPTAIKQLGFQDVTFLFTAEAGK